MTGVEPADPLGPVPLDGERGNAGDDDAACFRQVLGHFATGVTVVTTADGTGAPAGLSVNSFTSVSLDPPLVAFCVALASTTWSRIRVLGLFCVNILSYDQQGLARVFATRGLDKFRGVGWTPAESGAPVLDGALAWLDCTVEAVHEAGDHIVVVGRVRKTGVEHERAPLVFYRGGYGHFQS